MQHCDMVHHFQNRITIGFRRGKKKKKKERKGEKKKRKKKKISTT